MLALVKSLLCFICFIPILIKAQSCSGDFEFLTQSEINNFRNLHPDCKIINGNVQIGSWQFQTDIGNLSGFNGIEEITGDLSITGSIDYKLTLVNLQGFDSLSKIGGDLNIYVIDQLTDLTGLNHLDSIGGSLKIQSNYELTNIKALSNLKYVNETIQFEGNRNLTSLEGLEGIKRCGDLRILFNNNLRILSGLKNLQSVDKFWMIENTALQNLVGLESLKAINGNFTVDRTEMTSLNGIESVEIIKGKIEIIENEFLCSCDQIAICNSIQTGKEVILKQNNSGCNTKQGILDWCDSEDSPQCYGRLTVWSQAEVDNFQNNYPNIDFIDGDLTISGEDIINLEGLNIVKAIGGDLKIIGNENLIDLEGLESLSEILGKLEVIDNPKLSVLKGLNNVFYIGGMEISQNNSLTDLTGLNSLESTSPDGIIRISNNPNFESFNGLNALSRIEGNLSIEENDRLRSFDGLDSIRFIGGLSIYRNDSLVDLEGLESVISIGNAEIPWWIGYDRTGMAIISNPSLQTLKGLGNVSSISGSIFVEQNKALLSFDELNIANVGGGINISENLHLQNLDGLDGLYSIGSFFGGFDLNERPVSNSLTINSNPELNDLNGLRNISRVAGDIYIASNTKMTSLEALHQIDPFTIDGLVILNNQMLSICAINSICGFFEKYSSNGNYLDFILIRGNAYGCNDYQEVKMECGLPPDLSHSKTRVYPNPVEGVFSIISDSDVYKVQIFDISGKLVRKFEQNETYNITSLDVGMYLLEIQTQSGIVKRKVWKQ